MNERAVLFEVLTIIGYQDDKAAFVQKFFAIVYTEVIAQLNATLSEETKATLGSKLTDDMDLQAARAMILQYIPQETFDKKVEEVTKEQFQDYLETMYPTLSKETTDRLNTFLTSLPKPA